MMLLFPKKPKFLKSFSNKKIVTNLNKKNNNLKFSNVGLVAKQSGFMPNFQIESIRILLRRTLKKRSKIFFRIFPNQPITKKPNEVRLGRGKGNFKYWTYYIKKGQILIELNGNNTKLLTTILNIIKYKLTIKSYIYNQNFRWTL